MPSFFKMLFSFFRYTGKSFKLNEGRSHMLNYLQQELNELVDRGLDRRLRIAVTGLSRSGKTAFITSLVDQLLYMHSYRPYEHLPLFNAAQFGHILAVKRLPQGNLSIPRFDYEKNMQALQSDIPRWPDSTRGVSETRLAIRYQRQAGLVRHLQQTSTLYVDIFDYPGEWLLDLPLLEMDYQQWCQQMRALVQSQPLSWREEWLAPAMKLDLTAMADEQVLANIAKEYTHYLLRCKEAGLSFIQPGRFVLPAELADAPVLQFFPLLHLNEEEWKKLEKKSKSGSYFALLKRRYEHYREHIVKRFYKEHFSTFDRQIVLVDCLTALNQGESAFHNMQYALQQLFHNFHYGKRYLLNRLFSPCIDKLMFVATKADHITRDQMSNVVQLLRLMVQEGSRHLAYEGIQTEYGAIASICATQPVVVTQQGKRFNAVQGVLAKNGEKVTLFPGEVPSKLPSSAFWQQQGFAFEQFAPPQMARGDVLPHLRLDAVLQFLLGDKLV